MRLAFGVEVDTGAIWGTDAGPGADKGRGEGVEELREEAEVGLGVVGNGGSMVGEGLATVSGVL